MASKLGGTNRGQLTAIQMANAQDLADAYAEKHNCDVLLCSGPMGRSLDDVIHRIAAKRQHPNVLLVLTTEGGDAHVAYRVARLLQRVYDHIQVFVTGWCKSAGTLLAICGHELIVGDRGELGPIDVQRGLTDDLWQSTSGLTETAAVTTLEEIAWSLFRKIVTETKVLSGGQITFKTAADASAPFVSGMLTPIFAQIDPLKLGENARALEIASRYADRLDEHSDNLKAGSRDALVSGYPDHGFVIDREEAEKLFIRVNEPNPELRELCDALGDVAVYPNERPILTYLNRSQEIDNEDEQENPHDDHRDIEVANSNGDPTVQEPAETGSEPDAAVASGSSKRGRGRSTSGIKAA